MQTMTETADFSGFFQGTPLFLAELAANNDRSWFTDHKAEYQEFVQTPLRRLVTALAPTMLDIDPGFDVDPRGAAVSRIYRDTRFSRNKAPYRVNQWISFKRPSADWPSRPVFFVEIRPDGYGDGLGFYGATPATMAALRAAMVDHTPRFLAVAAAATAAGYGVEGDLYKRPRLPSDLPDSARDWYARKNLYLARKYPIDPAFFSTTLVERVRAGFVALEPLYRFLADVVATAAPSSP
jgi:uncharacterized protein (TIGR02453 family)